MGATRAGRRALSHRLFAVFESVKPQMNTDEQTGGGDPDGVRKWTLIDRRLIRVHLYSSVVPFLLRRRRRFPRRAASLLLALLLLNTLIAQSLAAPSPAPRQAALCEVGIERAEQHWQTPPGLLATIAKVESGRPVAGGNALEPWPWTINADGEGYFFATKESAVAFARQALMRGVLFMDVGCMQVDLQMHPTAFRNLEEAFDPTVNADYGARFLRALHEGPADGNWYIAVGLYHSRTPNLAAAYRRAVTAVGLGLYPSMLDGAGGPLRGRIRLVLAGGGATLLNVHRQPARWHRRPLSACQMAAILGSYLRSPPQGCRR